MSTHPGIRVLTQGAPIISDEDRKERAKKPTPAQRALAGKYRLIHGRIAMPRSPEDIAANPLDTRTIMYAETGAELDLDDEAAARLVDAGVVEPLDTPIAESRMGKCWKRPETVTNWAR